MKHIIIGTSGHIDHGKTSLVRAITGRETDNLKEEKERGISINLGFTYFDLPSGRRAGIIDVPGHEKFIKNMLAGVSSVDLILLVIAADEGIMPQTREHLEILKLLNIKKGIVVLTKIDMVEEEWISMVKEEVMTELKGSFLEDCSIIPVSSRTGEGIDILIKTMDELTDEIETKDVDGHFRLPVDRVFSVSGFGTVVTGTIVSGFINEGDTVKIYPSGAISKVRGLEVHDEKINFAEAGQRCAVNLSNIKTSDVQRGDVVSVINIMEPSMIIDCKLNYLKSSDKTSVDRPLVNRQRVRLYHGTSEILCRAVILDKEEIMPLGEAYVQFRLEKELTVQRGDRFVIRSYSPMYTIGGGIIIEPNANKAKRFDEKYISDLKVKESGEVKSILENTIEKISENFVGLSEILKALGKNEENLEKEVQNLVSLRRVIKLSSNTDNKSIYMHRNYVQKKGEVIENILLKFHKLNPLKAGMSKEELKNKVFGKNLKQKSYDELLIYFYDKNIIELKNNFVLIKGFEIKYTKEQTAIKNKIIEEYSKGKFIPPKYEDILALEKDKKNFKMVYDSLIELGILVKLSEECTLLTENYLWCTDKITNYLREKGHITASEFRDTIESSRKYAVAILEHFDSIKLTKRVEDNRVLA